MERQPFLLCFGAILLRCEGGGGLACALAGLKHGHGSSMIASDIRVMKKIIQRVRIDHYKARYDRVLMLIGSTAPPHTVYTHTPGRLTRRRRTGCGVACLVMILVV